jgi:hypothetical protein
VNRQMASAPTRSRKCNPTCDTIPADTECDCMIDGFRLFDSRGTVRAARATKQRQQPGPRVGDRGALAALHEMRPRRGNRRRIDRALQAETLVGADEFAKLDDAEIRRLCDAIDAEILKDPVDGLSTCSRDGHTSRTS